MSPAKHHILVIGGTGLCGLLFIRAALDAGHEVTVYARTPSKIPDDLSSKTNLHTIQGELGDEEGLKKAAVCGADVFVSLAGPTLGRREGTVSSSLFYSEYKLTHQPAHNQRAQDSLSLAPLQWYHQTRFRSVDSLILCPRRPTLRDLVARH